MSQSVPETGAFMTLSHRVHGVAVHVLFAGVLCLLGAVLVGQDLVELALAAAGTTAMVLALACSAISLRARHINRRAERALRCLLEHDSVSSLLSGPNDNVHYLNPSAQKGAGAQAHRSLSAWFGGLFANPSGLVYALQTRAAELGSASEDITTRAGTMRISATLAAPDLFVWRVEDLERRSDSARLPGVDVPMMTLGRNGTVLSMNETARTLAGKRVKSVGELVSDLPLVSGKVHRLATTDGEVEREIRLVTARAGREEMLLLPPRDVGPSAPPRVTFESLPVALVEIGADGRILRCNDSALALLNTDTAVGKAPSEVMEGLGRPIEDWLEEAIAGRGLNRSEFLRLSRSDRETYVQVTLNRLETDFGITLIAVLNDATELKSLEAQFVQSQKMQAIGQLAGGIAHDFNNLLTAISGHCDLLLLRHDQGDQDYADLVQINQNANRAAALVGQLLAFSRKQTLRPQTLDLRDILADLTHLLNRLVGEKISLTLQNDPLLSPIRADKRQLEQVIMNLVVNARDSMPGGGAIRIETRSEHLESPLERDEARIAPGDYVTVKVVDQGVGIPQDKQQKIFEPFYTTKRTSEGTGLGLSTVYGIVKQTGGFIFVDSVPGHGSCFTIYLPVHDAGAPGHEGVAQTATRSKSQPHHGDGVVLLVEDEAPVRAFASRALRLRGYTVIEAESAEKALEVLEDADLRIDVFVTDVVMPGLDGPTWVRAALQDRPDTKVVFVSGYAEDVFKNGKVPIKDAVFLQKPFSLNELTETVHERLH